MDSISFPDLLRSCILILQDNRREIKAEYDSILLPYRCGGKLKRQHLRYRNLLMIIIPEVAYVLLFTVSVFGRCSWSCDWSEVAKYFSYLYLKYKNILQQPVSLVSQRDVFLVQMFVNFYN